MKELYVGVMLQFNESHNSIGIGEITCYTERHISEDPYQIPENITRSGNEAVLKRIQRYEGNEWSLPVPF